MALERLAGTMPTQTRLEDVVPTWPRNLWVYEDRFVWITVGEAPGETKSSTISQMVGKPGVYIRIQRDTQKNVREANEVIQSYLAASPVPQGLRVIGIPSSWWCTQDVRL